MMLFAYYKHRDIVVEYAFKCRSKVNIANLENIVNHELDNICEIVLEKDELKYLIKNVDDRFDNPDFYYFNLDRSAVTVTANHETGELDIRVKGIWWKVILYEIYILSIVNEAYTRANHSEEEITLIERDGSSILYDKINFLNTDGKNLKIMEFGTRRRFTCEWHEYVLTELVKNTNNIIGTSNVYYAMKYDLKPMGTMAHECFQALQGIVHPVKSQKILFYEWKDFWGKKYLYALTDIFPTNKFLKDFDNDLAKMYLGLRHDSGDPIEWGERMIDMYKGYGLNPKHKDLTFSDGLDVYDALPLYDHFHDRIGISFGIGTKLTNDMGDKHKALQIVMKIVKVDGLDVAKLSNNPEKCMCENEIYKNWLIDSIRKEIEGE